MGYLDYNGLVLVINKIKELINKSANDSMESSKRYTDDKFKQVDISSHNYAGSSSPGGAATSALTCTGNANTASNALSSVFAIPSNGSDNPEGGELHIGNQDGTVWSVDSCSNNFRIFDSNGGIHVYLDKTNSNNNYIIGKASTAWNSDTLGGYSADNFAKLSGAQFTGAVKIVSSELNGTYNGLLVGDDCYIGDCNMSNTIGLMGQTDNNIAYVKFGKNGGSLGYNGSKLVYDNSMVYTGQNITYGTNALTPGTSGLATGNIYLQYE